MGNNQQLPRDFVPAALLPPKPPNIHRFLQCTVFHQKIRHVLRPKGAEGRPLRSQAVEEGQAGEFGVPPQEGPPVFDRRADSGAVFHDFERGFEDVFQPLLQEGAGFRRRAVIVEFPSVGRTHPVQSILEGDDKHPVLENLLKTGARDTDDQHLPLGAAEGQVIEKGVLPGVLAFAENGRLGFQAFIPDTLGGDLQFAIVKYLFGDGTFLPQLSSVCVAQPADVYLCAVPYFPIAVGRDGFFRILLQAGRIQHILPVARLGGARQPVVLLPAVEQRPQDWALVIDGNAQAAFQVPVRFFRKRDQLVHPPGFDVPPPGDGVDDAGGHLGGGTRIVLIHDMRRFAGLLQEMGQKGAGQALADEEIIVWLAQALNN